MPGCETPSRSSPRPRRTATLERTEAPPAPVRYDLTDDVVFAISKPLGGTGLLVIAFGALLSILASSPIMIVNLLLFLAYVGLYYNYMFKTVQTASLGREELPDSPSGYEAIDTWQLVKILVGMHLGLLLPVLLVIPVLAFVPSLVAYTVPIIVGAAVYPVFAYPMTVLLTAQTLNPLAAFNYPAILTSIVSTFSSYALVLAYFLGLELAPVLARIFLVNPKVSMPVAFALNGVSAAWTMFAMISLSLFIGRYFYREKARLGWFN